jgi:hypothetical protein
MLVMHDNMTPKLIVTFCNRYPTEVLEGYDDWTT